LDFFQEDVLPPRARSDMKPAERLKASEFDYDFDALFKLSTRVYSDARAD
jgi:hypothetical protein